MKAKLGPDHPHTLASMCNLANSYDDLGRHADAVKLHEETLALMKAKLGPDHPDTLATMYNLAISYTALGRPADTLKVREEMLALMKAKHGLEHPDTLRNMMRLAWFLATCPDPKFRDPKRAVELAQKAVELEPKNADYWQTLGVARYRVADWRGAIVALGKVKELGSPGDSMEWFPLAMAHWQLGEKEEARKWYDRAVSWMDKNQPKDEELRRFRTEAAELLQLAEPRKEVNVPKKEEKKSPSKK